MLVIVCHSLTGSITITHDGLIYVKCNVMVMFEMQCVSF